MDCGAKACSQKVTKFLPIDFIDCLHNSVSKGQEFRFSTIFDLLCNSSGFQKSQHKSSLMQKSLQNYEKLPGCDCRNATEISVSITGIFDAKYVYHQYKVSFWQLLGIHQLLSPIVIRGTSLFFSGKNLNPLFSQYHPFASSHKHEHYSC